ncbi:MAG: MauE/DoxX family redox-associated membrane protein, partial [Armatimonadota bacterium]
MAALATDARVGKWLMLALRLIVGGVFIGASVDKIIHVDRFADVVWGYQLLPEGLVNAFSACLPWVELVVGALLIAGVWLPSGALLAAGMTVMFMVGIGINLARGAEHFHCGCFGTGQEGPAETWGLM